MILYGIPNCDSVRAAKKWLQEAGVEFTFHDFRKDGLNAKHCERWLRECGAERVINRRGTTWRKLDDRERSKAEGDEAVALLLENVTLIKRPVLEHSTGIEIGFSAARYTAILAGAD